MEKVMPQGTGIGHDVREYTRSQPTGPLLPTRCAGQNAIRMLKEGEQKKIGTPAGKSGTPGGAAKSPGEKTPIQNKNSHPGNKGKHSIPNPEVLKSSTSKVAKSAGVVEVASQMKRV